MPRNRSVARAVQAFVRRPAVLAAVLAAAATLAAPLAACSDGSDASPPPPEEESPSEGLEASVDWRTRTVELSGRAPVHVAFCEGQAPLLCVSRDGVHLGAVELVTADPVDDLRAWADAHYDAMAADRRQGCHPGYVLDGEDPEPARLGDGDGVRYAWTGSIDDRPVERVVGYAAVVEGRMFVLVAHALADDGCLAREGELPLDAMAAVEPVLAALASGSTLPDVVGALADGTHTGRLVALSAGGEVTLDPVSILSGEEAVAAARADGALPPDGVLPNDVYVDDAHPDPVTLHLAEDASVALYDCAEGCELVDVSFADLVTGVVAPFGGPSAVVEVDVVEGRIVALREVYLP